MVLLEQSATSLPRFDDTIALGLRPADHLISDALVTALVVIVSCLSPVAGCHERTPGNRRCAKPSFSALPKHQQRSLAQSLGGSLSILPAIAVQGFHPVTGGLIIHFP